MNARRQDGFTLLEIIAALALLALLMLGVWTGIRTATQSVHHGRTAATRLDTKRGTGQFLRRNLSQVRPIPWARTHEGRAVVFVGNARVMRFVAPLPGLLGHMGPQLQTLSLVSDGEGTLRLEIAFALLPPDGSTPQPFGKPEVLMAGISKGHFIYRGLNLKRQDTGWREQWSSPSHLPSLAKIVLQPAHGSWPTLTVPLRVDRSAVNPAVVRVTELQELRP